MIGVEHIMNVLLFIQIQLYNLDRKKTFFIYHISAYVYNPAQIRLIESKIWRDPYHMYI